MGNWPAVVLAARVAIEATDGPTLRINSPEHMENKLLTCLNQVCRTSGAVHKNKVCYNIGASAFYLGYVLDVRRTVKFA
jgi:hypothetical protein